MNKLKALRAESGLSLRELSRKSEVDQSTISLLENDRQKAYLKTISNLAKALSDALGRHVPLDDFEDLIDQTASIRGRKGGTPSHKSRQFQAASAPANVVPVQATPKELDRVLKEMEAGKAANPSPAPVKQAVAPAKPKPRAKVEVTPARRPASLGQTASKLMKELGYPFGQIKRFIEALPDGHSLDYDQLKAAVINEFKQEPAQGTDLVEPEQVQE